MSDSTKRILLISYNYAPELTGIGKYNGEMVNWLVRKGYECSVLTAYPYYPFWKTQPPYRGKRFFYHNEELPVDNCSERVRVYRCPMYVPAQPSGIKRMLLDLSFFFSALLRLLTLLPGRRFDFVIAVSPSFQVGLLGVLYKKVTGAKLLYHVQDLQIEAARALKIIKSDALIDTLLKTEQHIFREADLVSSISEEMVRTVGNKAGKPAFLFPNWTDVHQFFPLENRQEIKSRFGFSANDLVVLYSGAIGQKQGLDAILKAARANRDNKRIKFVLCGAGAYKDALVDMATRLGLDNVCFLPLQAPSDFNAFLNMADIHLVIQKASASGLVMPSKLGAILAVGGVALVTANKGSSLHTIISKYDMGFLVEAENQAAFEEGLRTLATHDYRHLGENARRYAVDVLSIDKIMMRFERRLTTLLPGRVMLNSGDAAGAGYSSVTLR